MFHELNNNGALGPSFETYAVLLFIALVILITIEHVVHDFIRATFPKYDMWLYDEVRRQNRKR